MLDGFFARSPDLMCIAGFDGRFDCLNPAWTKHLGWTQEQLQAASFLDLVHPDDRAATQAELARLLGGSEAADFDNRCRHQDGSYRWLQWSVRSEPGDERFYAIGRDITRIRRLEREIIEIADREKERLGRELHDSLCQTLAGIAALGTTLSRKLAAGANANASAAAAEITELLNQAIGEARDLARGLSPIGLQESGLAGALAGLALNVRHRFCLACTVDCVEPFPGLDREVAAHLFRIAQEAVHNAVTHGRADRIEISLRGDDGKEVLSVRDNGVGLPAEALHGNGNGIGLRTMAYRARQIGGSLEVRRDPLGGTAVICVSPRTETIDIRESREHDRSDD